MFIKVLGPGCTKCKKLEQMTREMVAELNLDAEVQKIDDIQLIMAYGIMATPGLVIDEKLIFSGYLPAKNDLRKILETAKDAN